MRIVLVLFAALLASPSWAQAPTKTQAALAAHIAALETIITTAQNQSAVKALVAQQAPLQKQIQALETQLAAINAKIQAAEGPDVAEARRELVALQHPHMPWLNRPIPGAPPK
jgi:peptidoglycan hydrolase CwlO-like protein